MERGYIATKESEFYKDLEVHRIRVLKQIEQVKEFFKSKNIESIEYYLSGNGGVNCSFDEDDKKDITLCIIPTINDKCIFGKELSKPTSNGLYKLKKGSKIMKDFAQFCIDNRVVINCHSSELRDYFKTIGWNSYSRKMFPCEEGYCIEISSDNLEEDDIPQGFESIKLSEFYSRLELFQAEKTK